MSSNYYYRSSSSSSRTQWSPALRPLIMLQLLLSAGLLLSAMWQRFDSGLMAGTMMNTITIATAAFTLLSAIFNISSSAANLAVLEVVVPDTISLALWGGIICEAMVGKVLGREVGGAGLLSAVLVGKLFVAASVRVRDTRMFDEEAAVDVVVVVMVDEKALADNPVVEVDGRLNSNDNANV